MYANLDPSHFLVIDTPRGPVRVVVSRTCGRGEFASVRIGVEAPDDVRVDREEIAERRRAEAGSVPLRRRPLGHRRPGILRGGRRGGGRRWRKT